MALAPATVLTPGAAPAPTSVARATGRAFVVVLAGCAVALALGVLGLKLAGWQTLTVLTGSMRPSIAPGQSIVVSPMRAAEIAPGQVITFRRPQATGTVTHRVQRLEWLADGRLSVTTKGDANPVGETWQIGADGRVGRHRATLPAAGGAIGSVVAGPGRPYLLGATVVLGTLLVLFWIWWPAPRGPEGGPPTAPSRPDSGGTP